MQTLCYSTSRTVGQRSNGTSAITDILISEGSSFSHLDVTIKSPTSDQALSNLREATHASILQRLLVKKLK